MKKLVSVVLALCLVCSALFAVACGKEKTARELVESACQKFENVDAYDASIEYDITMNMQGMTMTMPVVANVKITDANTEKAVSDVQMSMELMGQKVDMRIYMENGWAYYDMLGMQYKTGISEAEAEYSNMINCLVAQTDYSYLDNAELVKNEDGTKTVVIELDEELANEIGKAASGMVSAAGTGEDVEINNVKYEYIIDKNENLVKINMACDMAMTVQGIAVDADMVATLSFNAFGDDVTVTAPDGYLDFEEAVIE